MLRNQKNLHKNWHQQRKPTFCKELILIWSVSHGLSSLTIDNTYLFKDFLRIVQRSLTYFIWNNQKKKSDPNFDFTSSYYSSILNRNIQDFKIYISTQRVISTKQSFLLLRLAVHLLCILSLVVYFGPLSQS